jgi:signal transduction histidine kinase
MDPQQTKLYTAVLIACGIIGLIIAYFIISLIRHQRRYVQLTRRNVLAELSLIEKDRMRVAADLHDDLAPVLSAVKFQLDSIDSAAPEDLITLKTSKHQIDHLAVRIREIAKDLMPSALTKKDMPTALHEFIAPINKSGILNIILEYKATTVLPEEKRIHLYRIIQEITHNTIKHAKAKTLLLRITQSGNTLKVLCEDNGQGFNYQRASIQQTGLGLNNIKSRVDIIGSNYGVKSVVGKGTQYIFDITLNKTS